MTHRVETLAEGISLHPGDCLDVLKTLQENSIDSCVTDPPYGLGFMGKHWDHGVPGVEYWRLVLRVLKPGAHLIAFGGTRTYHRMACAIEDVGFEIRDSLQWLYGSGFPKSLDVSKAIDRAAGAEREIIRERYTAKRIKPGATVVREGAYGKQDISFTACDTAPATDDAAQWQGFGTALKPACEPIVLARKPLSESTVVANVLRWGTGALNIDGCRVGTEIVGWGGARGGSDDATQSQGRNYRLGDGEARPVQGRWPANVLHDGSDETVGAFPDAPGQQRALVGGEASKAEIYGKFGPKLPHEPRKDSGSAARFFYTAKADADDRLGSKHPTVKPLDLIQYLVRLGTPPNGLVLDPFAGSGTTGEACIRERFRCILIEREPEYCDDIRRRMRLAMAGPEERKREAIKAKGEMKPFDEGSLFA